MPMVCYSMLKALGKRLNADIAPDSMLKLVCVFVSGTSTTVWLDIMTQLHILRIIVVAIMNISCGLNRCVCKL